VIDFQNQARNKPSQRFLSICFISKESLKYDLEPKKTLNQNKMITFSPSLHQKSFQGLNFFSMIDFEGFEKVFARYLNNK